MHEPSTLMRHVRGLALVFALCGLSACLTLGLGAVNSGAQQTTLCTWRAEAQPDAPLAMNTVVLGPLAKTVAAEKEIYQCLDASGHIQTGVIDVETFVELVERYQRGRLTTVAQRVDLVTCIKHRDQLLQTPPRVPCKARALPLVKLDNKTFLGCAFTTLPHEPVTMDTVTLSDGKRRVVKTIKLDKEVLDCDERIVDLYLFTELTQIPTTRGFKPGPRTFSAIACTKQRTTPGPSPTPPRVSCGRVAV